MTNTTAMRGATELWDMLRSALGSQSRFKSLAAGQSTLERPCTGCCIRFLRRGISVLRYGRVDRVYRHMDRIVASVQVANGVWEVLGAVDMIFCVVPDSHVRRAKKEVDAALNPLIFGLCTTEGVKIAVLANAAEGLSGLSGGSAIMSGLANIGGGSVAAGGAGAVGGLVIVAAAPSLLAVHTLHELLPSKCHTERKALLIGSTVGGVTFGGTGVGLVSAGGAVSGLSGSGISSGLAALGGGGMLGGVAAVAAMVTGGTVAVGALAWAIKRSMNESTAARNFQMMESLLKTVPAVADASGSNASPV